MLLLLEIIGEYNKIGSKSKFGGKFRSSHQRFCKKGVLRNFTKITGKHLCQSLRPATLLKKRFWHRCFPVNFAKFLRTPFFRTPPVANENKKFSHSTPMTNTSRCILRESLFWFSNACRITNWQGNFSVWKFLCIPRETFALDSVLKPQLSQLKLNFWQ